MERSQNFQDLIVWQKAQFCDSGIRFTRIFPKEEMYALSFQLRPAAISIAANIAEGFKRQSARDKNKFLNISQGSVEECRYYLILSKDLNFGDDSSLIDRRDQ